MKHIKPYKIFENSQEPQQHPGFPETKEEIHRLCKKYNIKNYTINKDLSIDVDSNVYIYGLYLIYIPLNFNYVSGQFFCNDNFLKSLKGSPKILDGDFKCSNNPSLKSLKGGPMKVIGVYDCHNTKIISLNNVSTEIGGQFNCSDNFYLKTLETTNHNIFKNINITRTPIYSNLYIY